MTTAAAQRHLLEALADLERTPGGIDGLLIAMPSSIAAALDAGYPELAAVFTAIQNLASAVQADLNREESRHA